MPNECIFCRIAAGEIPAKIVQRDKHVIAISDANPQAPEHLLVMPVQHARDLAEFTTSAPPEAIANLFKVVADLGSRCGPNGYRALTNTGSDGGQTVDHLHIHILAGRKMHWPPG